MTINVDPARAREIQRARTPLVGSGQRVQAAARHQSAAAAITSTACAGLARQDACSMSAAAAAYCAESDGAARRERDRHRPCPTRRCKVAQLHLLESGPRSITEKVGRRACARAAPQLTTSSPAWNCSSTCRTRAARCARAQRSRSPAGMVLFSTINRNPKSYLFAVVGAEYVLRTAAARHARIREIHQALRAVGMVPRKAVSTSREITGMTYNPLTGAMPLGSDTGRQLHACIALA